VKITAAELLQRIPGSITEKWPHGEPFAVGLRHGSMLVELFAPSGIDNQTPHAQDELYFVRSGSGTFVIGAERHSFAPGTCFFVPAGVAHRFEEFSPDFSTWVVFWGPQGGETAA
jgi:mannose-6-phosphate isomerase-like protein (cupin superfamily)